MTGRPKGGRPSAPAGDRDWLSAFPELAALDDAAHRRLAEATRVITLPPRTTLFHEGDACHRYLFVLDGSVRVQKLSESGREITLYRVDGGQTCILTTACLLSHQRYPAIGITETEVLAVTLPERQFQLLLAESTPFREFVFAIYGRRISELIMLIDAVAFGRMDMRLATLLLNTAGGSEFVVATHQELGIELGTAREVISRLLKEFEHRGLVTLHRGRIDLVDRDALAVLSRPV